MGDEFMDSQLILALLSAFALFVLWVNKEDDEQHLEEN